eukprot:CAMPEP_0114550512 /NCGR_PEP_ID=MMETSP0114-20121206/6112_1 /TAXON_ID=31324 /ORGANISM="Goniomonas sp, Strain m" /LENGTH=294 /DNA_ID=CAMNT_0001735289 /DNA_START=8 /DNA_END=892 /DNA_ORIENTATION=-
MGLLLGDVKTEENSTVAHIWGLSLHMRSDRREDRVEIHPEQLAAAAAEAERLTQTLGMTTRVIGWYHSHPHITVLPSHVDVKTQGQYQMLDDGFIGLIFSVFTQEANKTGRIQVTAFQSLCIDENGNEVPTNMSRTGSAEGDGATDPQGGIDSAIGSQRFYQQKEVNLSFQPSNPAQHTAALQPLVDLQRILLREEKDSYHASLHRRADGGRGCGGKCDSSGTGIEVHPLQALHSAAVYQKVLCRLMELSSIPLLYTLESRSEANRRKLKLLEEEEKALLNEIQLTESTEIGLS